MIVQGAPEILFYGDLEAAATIDYATSNPDKVMCAHVLLGILLSPEKGFLGS